MVDICLMRGLMTVRLSEFVKSGDGKEAGKKVWMELSEILEEI